MTATIHSLTDDDIVLRDLTTEDHAAVGEFFGADRMTEGFVASGMHIDAAAFDLASLVDLARARPDEVRLWIATTPRNEPICLQIFHRTGFPGEWTYSVVTGTRVAEGHGIGTRMITLGIDRLFSDPRVNRLAGYVSVVAPAPWRIAQRLGFVVEGRARELIVMPDGSRVDAHLVSLLRDEWLVRRAEDVR